HGKLAVVEGRDPVPRDGPEGPAQVPLDDERADLRRPATVEVGAHALRVQPPVVLVEPLAVVDGPRHRGRGAHAARGGAAAAPAPRSPPSRTCRARPPRPPPPPRRWRRWRSRRAPACG